MLNILLIIYKKIMIFRRKYHKFTFTAVIQMEKINMIKLGNEFQIRKKLLNYFMK